MRSYTTQFLTRRFIQLGNQCFGSYGPRGVHVCRAKVLAISKDERSLPRQLPVQRVAPGGARAGDRPVQVRRVQPPASNGCGGGETAGRNTREPIRASRQINPEAEPLCTWRRLILPGHATGLMPGGSGGVVGTARRERERAQLGRPVPAAGAARQPRRIRLKPKSVAGRGRDRRGS